ncbi:hypothetical protein VKT23_010193 [Stygiomarasmius scandens]|uniref:Uncharacterized protein n=1 Tax=Marasmiellus scandens TaxID=2682957 RepID=A0ABR1JCB7_9AGAR
MSLITAALVSFLITFVSFPAPFDGFNVNTITSALSSDASIATYSYGTRIGDPNQVELWMRTSILLSSSPYTYELMREFLEWNTTSPDVLFSELIEVWGGSGPLQTYQVPFHSESSALTALKAPVTEVLICSLKSGINLTSFEELLIEGNELHVGVAGFHDADYGFVNIGNVTEKAIIVLGWDSKEVSRLQFGLWISAYSSADLQAHDLYAATGVLTPIVSQYVEFVNTNETVQFYTSYTSL